MLNKVFILIQKKRSFLAMFKKFLKFIGLVISTAAFTLTILSLKKLVDEHEAILNTELDEK